MEIVKYINTKKKYRLPELIGQNIAVNVPTLVDMTVVYTQIKSIFTDMEESYKDICQRYVYNRKTTKDLCMVVLRSASGKIIILLPAIITVANLGYEIIEIEEIDFGIQIKRKE